MTRVLIVAERPEDAAALAALLNQRTDLVVVGTASRIDAALERGPVPPDVDVVLIEPYSEVGELPGRLGYADAPAPRLLLVEEPDATRTAQALRAGIRGVVPRAATPAELAAALEAVAAGLVVLPPELAEPLLAGRLRATRSAGTPEPASGTLTPREVEVLRLLAEGRGNKGIGAQLGISAYTAKTHVASILAKLGVATRAEAVAAGVRLGLILL